MGHVDEYDMSTKSHAKLGVLCLVGGILGMHRLYVEKVGSACIMAVLFFTSFVAFLIHPIAWGVVIGADILMMGIDFFRIMFNDFEDSYGKKVSPNNAIPDKEPIFCMLLFGTIGVYLIFVGIFIKNYIPAIAIFMVCAIFAVLELNYVFSKTPKEKQHMGLIDTLKKRNECASDKSLLINISYGYKELGIKPISTLRQKENGNVYFNINDKILYNLIEYEWSGPSFDTITKSKSTGSVNSETTQNGKSMKMLTGAVAGTIVAPGIGTAVGAAIGAGGKKKSKTKGKNEDSSITIEKQTENTSPAILTLQKISDGNMFSIKINCNTEIDSKIRCFNFIEPKTASKISDETVGALQGIKALKELLDIGAISEEEFEIKKKQILNL